MDGYVFQHPDFCLGNFINCTPAIRWLSQQRGERIPVYFSTDYVRQCFLDCPFIEILDEKPEHDPLFGSNLVNPNNDLIDCNYIFERVTGEKWNPLKFWTYVDVVIPPLDLVGAIVLVNGAGNENADYVARKDPGKEAYLKKVEELRMHQKVFAIGSEADYERNKWFADVADECFFGDIRQCLSIIYGASLVIANDTGLSHAAGALNKPQIVLTNGALPERVKNPSIYTFYRAV